MNESAIATNSRAATNPALRQPMAIERHANEAWDQMEALRTRINELAKRLEPVITPTDEREDYYQRPAPEMAPSPVAMVFCHQAAALQAMTDKVDSLLNHLEL